jgi:hypothetical protein
MLVTHELETYSYCPMNGDRDDYLVKMTFEKFILVEDIMKFFNSTEGGVFYQEAFTENISREFECVAETWCRHRGVKTYVKVGRLGEQNDTLSRDANNTTI